MVEKGKDLDFDAVKLQAQKVREEYPELFNYLVQRDEATAELIRELFSTIPRPDDVPKIDIPFINVVIELARPQEECPVCEEGYGEDWIVPLDPELRVKLCWYCRHGIYIRGSGIGSLTEG